MDYVVEKCKPETLPQSPQAYEIKYKKAVETVDGKSVEVYDRTERTSLEELESQKAELEKQVAELSAKIAAIKKLRGE